MMRWAGSLGLVAFLLTSVPVAADDPQPSMNKADWVRDLDTLYSQMQAIHPSLHHHTKAAEMDAYVTAFRKTIPNDSWPEYVMGLYKLLALVGDGHTTFYPMPDTGPGFETRYPVLTEAFSDGLYIVGADKTYANTVGAKVVAIDGHPIGDVFKTLTAYWDHENETWVLRWLPFILRRPGFLHGAHVARGDVDAPLAFTLEQNGARRDVLVTPMKAADDEARQKSDWLHARDETQVARPTALHGKDVPFDFVWLGDKATVYAVFNQSSDGDKETVEAFAARLFAFIDTHKVDKLILDVRENGGGDNYTNQPLILGAIKARNIDRPGHLFLLTGRRTFSAAQNFCNQMERWTQALFVGEPTGSAPNLYGDAKQFELPLTHLHPMVSTLYWEDSMPNDERVWILPDVPAPLSFADWKAGRDPVLEAALAYHADAKATAPNTHWFRKSQKAQWTLPF